MSLQLKNYINEENVKMSKVDIRKYLFEILYSDLFETFENDNKKSKTLYSDQPDSIPGIFLTYEHKMKIHKNKDKGYYNIPSKSIEEFNGTEMLGEAS
ncbi:hypothetical protein [Staphylococcus cohnii]